MRQDGDADADISVNRAAMELVAQELRDVQDDSKSLLPQRANESGRNAA